MLARMHSLSSAVLEPWRFDLDVLVVSPQLVVKQLPAPVPAHSNNTIFITIIFTIRFKQVHCD
jgi:hypothetical protein